MTLIHRHPSLSHRIKYWVRPDIENRIKNGEIQALFETQVVEIRPDSILVAPANTTGDREAVRMLRNDFVFALIGYRPDSEFLRARRRPDRAPPDAS